MKKVILILGATASLILAGCDRGGTSDKYDTSSGAVSSSSNAVQNSGAHGSTNSN